jgi:hypothetical protein
MDLVSVCPLRIAGTLFAVDAGIELRVVVRATLEPSAEGALELAPKQVAPDADDCLYLVEQSGVPRVPRRGVRLPAESLGPGMLITFPGSPPGQSAHRLPDLTPFFFIEQPGGGRRVPLALGEVALDASSRVLGVVWQATVTVTAEEAAARAILAIGREDESISWTDVAERADADDGPLQRSHIEVRQPPPRASKAPLESESKPNMEDTLSLDTGELDDAVASTALPFGPTEASTLAFSNAPLDAALPFSRRDSLPPIEPADSKRGESKRPEPGALETTWVGETALTDAEAVTDLASSLARVERSEVSRAVGALALGMRTASPVALAALPASLARAVVEGVFEAPAVVVSGRLEMQLDPVERLRALVSASRTFAVGHERLGAVVDRATAALAADGAWTFAEPQTASLLEALAAALAPETLRAVDEAVARKLARERKLVRVDVAGGPHVVLHLAADAAAAGPRAPVYVPVAAVSRLPLAPRFSARVLARAHPSFDDREPGRVALVARALFRDVGLATSAPT